ncbi:COG4695 Phage-related protein [uncultured Caudovirales phage]|uniref:COG4695 Phage-related protein n=1 Tax=uncultured Caudovirales phage TaxID=2100421 RepID=A0A6J7WRC0_9CAUD|nr:COG4695 Phage-related protein [uncultured Caudovirales phage]
MLRNLAGSENRSISFQTIWGAGDLSSFETQAGSFIDYTTALSINSVWACVSLIADTISALPVDTYVRRDGIAYPYRPRPAWVARPDAMINSTSFWQQAMISLLLDGNAFVRIFRDPITGQILSMMVLNPMKVSVSRKANGTKRYVVQDEGNKELSSDDMLHITGSILMPGDIRGKSTVDTLKENLGLSMSLESFAARFFGQGTQTSGVIEYPGALTAEQADNLSKSFDRAHRGYRKAHKTGILSGGATFKPTQVANDQAQMLDSRRLAVEDVARIFRVPSNMIGLNEKGAQSYNSNEQNAISFVTHTLRPWLAKLEDAFSALLPDTAFLQFNTDDLLRGDYATRIEGYAKMLQNGVISANEVRRKENLRPVAGGDTVRVPLANVDIAAAGLTEDETKIAMAQKLIGLGFVPEDVLKSLGLDPIAHTGLPSVQIQNPTTVPAGSYETGE